MRRNPNKERAVNIVSRRHQLVALKRESEHEMAELIRRRLDLPIEKRTHFLRVRLPLPNGGSCL
jgi:hypothetical protein